MIQSAKAVFNWSGGKDSALSLYKVQRDASFTIECLLTTVNEKYKRVSMHGVRDELLELQAQSLQIPLVQLMLPEMPSMKVYENKMRDALEKLKQNEITHSIFGDIFLEDLKKYREIQLQEVRLQGVFPIWKCDSKALINEFIDLGFKSILVCVNEKYLDKSFAGRLIDKKLLKDLPEDIDPCGENGEYHSFVFDGPNFSFPIPFRVGETVYRKYSPDSDTSDSNYSCSSDKDPFDTGFWYTDLI